MHIIRPRRVLFLFFFSFSSVQLQWPPKIVYDVFDVNTYVGNCLKLHNPDVAKLRELELSTNFDQLPDDRSIKCYLHCMMLESGLMQPNSTAINFARLIDAINLMEKPEQDIYLKMGRKCNKKNKDVCEMIYQLNVCVKQNDNEVSVPYKI